MTYLDRTSAADGHILIGGTGRAGTTLLVQWFTALCLDTGLDTGFDRREDKQEKGRQEVLRAGLHDGRVRRPDLLLPVPDFALGRQDLYATLGPVLEPQGVTRDEADQAFAAVV